MIKGPIFTVFTAFKENGELNLKSTLDYLDFLLSSEAKVLYTMPYNSRFLQLTIEEILKLNKEVISLVKSNKNSKIIVGGPVEISTQKEMDFAKQCFDFGADYYASVFGEKYFSLDQVIQHYGSICSLGGNIVVHEQPLISGYNSKQIHWPLELIKEVASMSRVSAFKEDAKSTDFGRNLLEMNLDATMIFAGRKRLFLSMMDYGLKSYLNGISMVNPKIAFKFWTLFQKKDQRQVEEFISIVDDPFWDNLVSKYGWHRVNKASLQYFGFMDRFDRMPMPHLNKDEYLILKKFWDQHQLIIDQWV